MADGVAHVSQIQRCFGAKFSLDIQTPGVDGRHGSVLINGTDANGESSAARNQHRRDVIDVATINVRCVGERRISEPVEVIRILSDSLEESTEASTNTRFRV